VSEFNWGTLGKTSKELYLSSVHVSKWQKGLPVYQKTKTLHNNAHKEKGQPSINEYECWMYLRTTNALKY